MTLTPEEKDLLIEIRDGVAYWLSIKDEKWVVEAFNKAITKDLRGAKKNG